MISPNAILGLPVDAPGGCKVYPPTVGDIISTPDFSYYRHFLLQSQEEIEDLFRKGDTLEDYKKNPDDPTPLEFLLINAHNEPQYNQIILKAFEFFIKEPVRLDFENKIIVVGNLHEKISHSIGKIQIPFLTEKNFLEFQNKVRESIGEDPVEPEPPNLYPQIRRIKAKGRYRDRIKAKKKGTPLAKLLIAACVMGAGVTPLNLKDVPYAAFLEIISLYREKEVYDFNLRVLSSGFAKGGKEIHHWMENKD